MNGHTKEDFLIVGKTPLPIGGVTIHVERLLQHLKLSNFPYDFIDLREGLKLKYLFQLRKASIVHLHTSNVFLRLFVAFICRVVKTKCIATFHGNLGRFNNARNSLDNLSIRLLYVPIVINDQSFSISIRINKKTVLESAFIPPLKTTPLKPKYSKPIIELSKQTKIICTNAYHVSFDKYGRDIYGIIDLLSVLTSLQKINLVVSDPSGTYFEYIRENRKDLLESAIWICEPHDFYEVLKLSDGFVRNTTTDGDSLSIREAIFLGKKCFATDVVDRPPGTVLYKNKNELKLILESWELSKTNEFEANNFVFRLLDLYKNLLNEVL